MTGGEIDARRVGLCFGCVHARTVATRTSLYWMCELSKTDPRFAKYPRLPVVVCEGYEARDPASPTPPENGGSGA